MISFVDLQIECIKKNIKLLQSKLKEEERQLVLWQRQKWWLLNPEIATIRYIPMYETNYSHSEWETYPIISWQSIVDVNGQETWNVDTVEYPLLESEITDEETVLIVRNPYATI